MNWIVIVRFVLSLLVGSGVFNVSSTMTGGDATFEITDKLAPNIDLLWSLAGMFVTNYMPEGWLKKIALLIIGRRKGNSDTSDLSDFIDQFDDLTPFFKEIFKRLAREGAPPEQLRLIKQLGEEQIRKAFTLEED